MFPAACTMNSRSFAVRTAVVELVAIDGVVAIETFADMDMTWRSPASRAEFRNDWEMIGSAVPKTGELDP